MKHCKKLIGTFALSAFMLFQSGKSIAQKKNTLDAQLQGIELITKDSTYQLTEDAIPGTLLTLQQRIMDFRPIAVLYGEGTTADSAAITYIAHVDKSQMQQNRTLVHITQELLNTPTDPSQILNVPGNHTITALVQNDTNEKNNYLTFSYTVNTAGHLTNIFLSITTPQTNLSNTYKEKNALKQELKSTRSEKEQLNQTINNKKATYENEQAQNASTANNKLTTYQKKEESLNNQLRELNNQLSNTKKTIVTLDTTIKNIQYQLNLQPAVVETLKTDIDTVYTITTDTKYDTIISRTISVPNFVDYPLNITRFDVNDYNVIKGTARDKGDNAGIMQLELYFNKNKKPVSTVSDTTEISYWLKPSEIPALINGTITLIAEDKGGNIDKRVITSPTFSPSMYVMANDQQKTVDYSFVYYHEPLDFVAITTQLISRRNPNPDSSKCLLYLSSGLQPGEKIIGKIDVSSVLKKGERVNIDAMIKDAKGTDGSSSHFNPTDKSLLGPRYFSHKFNKELNELTVYIHDDGNDLSEVVWQLLDDQGKSQQIIRQDELSSELFYSKKIPLDKIRKKTDPVTIEVIATDSYKNTVRKKFTIPPYNPKKTEAPSQSIPKTIAFIQYNPETEQIHYEFTSLDTSVSHMLITPHSIWQNTDLKFTKWVHDREHEHWVDYQVAQSHKKGFLSANHIRPENARQYYFVALFNNKGKQIANNSIDYSIRNNWIQTDVEEGAQTAKIIYFLNAKQKGVMEPIVQLDFYTVNLDSMQKKEDPSRLDWELVESINYKKPTHVVKGTFVHTRDDNFGSVLYRAIATTEKGIRLISHDIPFTARGVTTYEIK